MGVRRGITEEIVEEGPHRPMQVDADGAGQQADFQIAASGTHTSASRRRFVLP